MQDHKNELKHLTRIFLDKQFIWLFLRQCRTHDEYLSRKIDVSISKNIEARYSKLYLLTDIKFLEKTN